MTTDISEKGLETLIHQAMTGRTGLEPVPDAWQEVSPTAAGGTGWLAGWSRDYDRTHALDTPQLFAFLQATQPDELKKLGIANFSNKSDIALLKFLARLESEIGLLREYRTRLVADVVTGKLDVRAAARHLPEEGGELPEPSDSSEESDGLEGPDLSEEAPPE